MTSVYIIAEAGVNHNGSLDMAYQLIDVAAEAEADAVKFQTFNAEKVISRNAPKAEYQLAETSNSESQLEMIKKLQFGPEDHSKLIDHCKKSEIEFLSTPFDLESVTMLIEQLNIKRLKISSGEITNGPLLLKAASCGVPIILSTGMSTLGEIEKALGILAFGYMQCIKPPSVSEFHKAYCSTEGQGILKENVTLLHCTTEYPAPYDEVNLKAMASMSSAFGLSVGLSDHTKGISIAIAAVACGASVIEKHFTLSNDLPGPDHKASMTPTELVEIVKSIRQVEMGMGSDVKLPTESEKKNMLIARKSLVAARPIEKGEQFTERNLTAKRPGTGISPLEYWHWLGRKAKKTYLEDDLI